MATTPEFEKLKKLHEIIVQTIMERTADEILIDPDVVRFVEFSERLKILDKSRLDDAERKLIETWQEDIRFMSTQGLKSEWAQASKIYKSKESDFVDAIYRDADKLNLAFFALLKKNPITDAQAEEFRKKADDLKEQLQDYRVEKPTRNLHLNDIEGYFKSVSEIRSKQATTTIKTPPPTTAEPPPTVEKASVKDLWRSAVKELSGTIFDPRVWLDTAQGFLSKGKNENPLSISSPLVTKAETVDALAQAGYKRLEAMFKEIDQYKNSPSKIDPDKLLAFAKEVNAYKAKLEDLNLNADDKKKCHDQVHDLVDKVKQCAKIRMDHIGEKRDNREKTTLGTAYYGLKDAKDFAKEKIAGKKSTYDKLFNASEKLNECDPVRTTYGNRST